MKGEINQSPRLQCGCGDFNPSVGIARMQRSAYERLVRKVKAATKPPACPWLRAMEEVELRKDAGLLRAVPPLFHTERDEVSMQTAGSLFQSMSSWCEYTKH